MRNIKGLYTPTAEANVSATTPPTVTPIIPVRLEASEGYASAEPLASLGQ